MNTSKLLQALHSRTVWATVVMLAFNFIPQLNINQPVKDLINSVLVLIIGYLHINPAIPGQYSPAGVPPPITPVVIDTAKIKTVTSNNAPSIPLPPQP